MTGTGSNVCMLLTWFLAGRFFIINRRRHANNFLQRLSPGYCPRFINSVCRYCRCLGCLTRPLQGLKLKRPGYTVPEHHISTHPVPICFFDI